MEGIGLAIWFFSIGSNHILFAPSRLGPMTEAQCTQLQKAVPELPGSCQKAIGMYACSIVGNPGVGAACPLFDGDIPVRTGQ